MFLLLSGQTVLPQAQRSVVSAGSVCGYPETVQLSRPDQGPGASEAAQPALPHEGPTQCPRDQVTQFDSVILSHATTLYKLSKRTSGSFWHLFCGTALLPGRQGGVGLAAESCFHSPQRQRSEPAELQEPRLHGQHWAGRICQVSESGDHTPPDEAQHPPLQGNRDDRPDQIFFLSCTL